MCTVAEARLSDAGKFALYQLECRLLAIVASQTLLTLTLYALIEPADERCRGR